MTDADTLHVRRHVVRYRSSDGPAARAARASLDRALTALLADRLAALVPPGADESVWLIRRLDVNAVVASSWSDRRAAGALAAGAVRALARTLEGGADGETVIWFPDRAAFLARFLLDLGDGRAAGKWEYGEFDDVVGHSSTAAIRTVVAREPACALTALISLTPPDLRRVLGCLAPPDADGALGALAPVSQPRGNADPSLLVVDALHRMLDASTLPAEPRAAALAVFLDVARGERAAPPAGTDARAREVAALAHSLRGAHDGDAARLADALAAGDWRAAGTSEMSRLVSLVTWPSAARREAVRLLVRARSGRAESARGPQGPRMTTNLGGMFLLLPLLHEFPWPAVTASWPHLDDFDDIDGANPAALVQYLAVIGALGVERNAAAALDPVLRLALGIAPTVDARAIAAWTTRIPRELIPASNALFVESLRRLGKVSGAVTLAPLGDRVVAVDGARGMWLGIASPGPSSIRELVASIDLALGQESATTGSEAWIEACLEPTPRQPHPIDERLLTRLDEQARYASLDTPFDLAPAIRDMVMLASHALGRELAWRLPGFARSSLPYLWDNVLSFAASVAVEPERFVVAVGDPPLHLLLSLTGMNRRRFHLDATGERHWVLTQAS